MRCELAIFDMDGTILNTLEDLTDSTNAALRQFGLPERTLDEVRSFVGNGIHLLIERAVPQNTDAKTIEQVYSAFLTYYETHHAVRTRPYPGITALLQSLREGGCKTAVVSNKAHKAVQELADRYFPGLFDMALGERQGIPRKPAPDSVNEVLWVLQVPREKAVYIGDSPVDVETARNARVEGIFVDWGFRSRETLLQSGGKSIVSDTEQLLSHILHMQ